MEEVILFDTLRAGIRIAVSIATPMLAAALIVGLAIGLFQALTSVQELTLTFVPKLAAMLAVFWLSMGFMTETLRSYFTERLVPLIAGG